MSEDTIRAVQKRLQQLQDETQAAASDTENLDRSLLEIRAGLLRSREETSSLNLTLAPHKRELDDEDS
jgi:hypothetical protein